MPKVAGRGAENGCFVASQSNLSKAGGFIYLFIFIENSILFGHFCLQFKPWELKIDILACELLENTRKGLSLVPHVVLLGLLRVGLRRSTRMPWPSLHAGTSGPPGRRRARLSEYGP